jgi:hydroxymethylbilane synthase
MVKDFLIKNGVFNEIELISMSTSGDTLDNETFKKEGGKGLFLKELESALLKGQADIAVHSMKDVPATLDARFNVSSIMRREDPRDVFISNKHKTLYDIKSGVIGSSSPRRQAILKHINAGIKSIEIRGNIQTRLEKLKKEKLDGIILAKSGLKRMGLDAIITESLDVDDFVPSPGQGILCLESLSKNDYVMKRIKKVVHANTEICGSTERIFASNMNGDCSSPIGAYAEIEKDLLTLTGYVASIDGTKFIKNKVSGKKDNYKKLAEDLSQVFLKMGSKRLLKC